MSAGEKSDVKPSLEKISDSQLEDAKLKAGSEDDLDFGGESTLPPPPALSAEERRLWRKIDFRLMPILTLMYPMSFLDRGNIGNARLDGLQDQLNLTGNKYNIALTMYFITVKKNKNECIELIEQIHEVVYVIIDLHVKSGVEELPISLLNQMGEFTEYF
ncbi:hypothetical protein DFH09DRAFT_1312639 [Mycena vulgaris]|nr:hypothetical protein DFH09DRAFT_1312639 [Mycena vulgaris]